MARACAVQLTNHLALHALSTAGKHRRKHVSSNAPWRPQVAQPCISGECERSRDIVTTACLPLTHLCAAATLRYAPTRCAPPTSCAHILQQSATQSLQLALATWAILRCRGRRRPVAHRPGCLKHVDMRHSV